MDGENPSLGPRESSFQIPSITPKPLITCLNSLLPDRKARISVHFLRKAVTFSRILVSILRETAVISRISTAYLRKSLAVLRKTATFSREKVTKTRNKMTLLRVFVIYLRVLATPFTSSKRCVRSHKPCVYNDIASRIRIRRKNLRNYHACVLQLRCDRRTAQ